MYLNLKSIYELLKYKIRTKQQQEFTTTTTLNLKPLSHWPWSQDEIKIVRLKQKITPRKAPITPMISPVDRTWYFLNYKWISTTDLL